MTPSYKGISVAGPTRTSSKQVAEKAQHRTIAAKSVRSSGKQSIPRSSEAMDLRRKIAAQLVEANEAVVAYQRGVARHRDEYYRELESLEPDQKLRDAIEAARQSSTQGDLLAAWRQSSKRPETRA